MFLHEQRCPPCSRSTTFTNKLVDLVLSRDSLACLFVSTNIDPIDNRIIQTNYSFEVNSSLDLCWSVVNQCRDGARGLCARGLGLINEPKFSSVVVISEVHTFKLWKNRFCFVFTIIKQKKGKYYFTFFCKFSISLVLNFADWFCARAPWPIVCFIGHTFTSRGIIPRRWDWQLKFAVSYGTRVFISTFIDHQCMTFV